MLTGLWGGAGCAAIAPLAEPLHPICVAGGRRKNGRSSATSVEHPVRERRPPLSAGFRLRRDLDRRPDGVDLGPPPGVPERRRSKLDLDDAAAGPLEPPQLPPPCATPQRTPHLRLVTEDKAREPAAPALPRRCYHEPYVECSGRDVRRHIRRVRARSRRALISGDVPL